MGIISTRLYRKFEKAKNQKIINIKELYETEKKIDEDIKTIKTFEQLESDHHPFHAAYVSTQNLVSFAVEALTTFSELDEYSKKYGKAETDYMPDYPPMSPVTKSFFTFWAYFDLRFGPDKETIGTCFLDLSEILQIEKGMVELIRKLNATRMGIYAHRGHCKDGSIILYEIFTHEEFRCYSVTEYQGTEGEIWLVRLAPPPFNMSDLYITITTPYIIYNTGQKDWEDYFDRVLPKTGINPPILAYNELMKYGLIPDYWSEYVFQAYSNYNKKAILLSGIPDKPGDLPHFNPDTGINLSEILSKEEKKKAVEKYLKKQKKSKKK